MIKDNIEIAQKIVGGSYNNINSGFGKYSAVYKTANENLTFFNNFVNNNSRVLTVTGSGDQVLNMLLYSDNIDAFDINIFSEYFTKLKIAGIKALDRNSYLNYFIENVNYEQEFSYDIYLRLSEYLDNDSLKFWNLLYSYFEGFEIYSSTLFSSEFVNRGMAIARNAYLSDYNYDKLKERINDVNISFFNLSLNDASFYFKEYDFIYLSNIINYMSIDNYNEIINRFEANGNLVIASFIYANLKSHYEEKVDGYKFYDIENSPNKLLIK